MPALAEAFVRVRPDSSGFRREAERNMGRDADALGKTIGDNAGRGFSQSFGRSITANAATTFNRLMRESQSAASSGGSAAGRTFGEGFTRDALGRLRDAQGRFVAAGSEAGKAFGEGFTRDANGRLRDARGRFVGEGRDAGDGFGRGFSMGAIAGMSGMQGLISAGIALGPAIIPAAAAAAAALAAIGPAALAGVAGLGVLALGFSGVIGAVKQMAAVEEQASQASATLAGKQAAVAGAMDQVRSAEAALGNTRRNVAEAGRRAAQQVTDAQRNLTSAERDALNVRRELSQAQEEARRALEDLGSQVRGNALDQQQANLDVAEARRELNRVLADPAASAAERQQAQITYQRQVLQMEDLRRRGARLAEEQRQAQKAGINGSEQVQAVRARIAQADERVREAQRRVSDARRDQQEQERQGAFQIAQATQAVVNAQRSLQQATTQAGVGGTAAMLKLRDAMAGLSPAGRTFATFLFGLKDEFMTLRRAAERGLLPGVQAGIQALLPYLPQIRVFIERIGAAMGGLAQRAGEALASPFWARFFNWLGTSAGPMLESFGSVIGGLAEGFAALMMAFAPLSAQMTSGLAGLARGFADWAKSVGRSSGFQEFIGYVRENGPVLVKLFGDIVMVTLKLLVALAPLGALLAKSLGVLFDWLAKQNPGLLLGIVAAVAAAVVGIAASVTSLSVPVVAVVAGITALVGALVYAYKNFEGFRKVVDTVSRAVAAAAMWMFEHVHKRAFTGLAEFIQRVLAPAFTWLWRNVIQPAFRGITAVVTWAWNNIIKPVLTALTWYIQRVLAPVFTWLWRNVITPVWQRIHLVIKVAWALIKVVFGLVIIGVKGLAAIFNWFWTHSVRPVWQAVYAKAIKPAWDKIRPVLQALGGFLRSHVVPAFQAGVTAIGRAWDRIRAIAAVPVRFVVEEVINKGIIRNYNKIARAFGAPTVGGVAMPSNTRVPTSTRPGRQEFARGGIMPGYSPGKDVHSFYSPTAGRLDLSGGEAILRPEATRTLGRGWVDGVNKAARAGGISGVQNFLGAYADGGILGALSGARRRAAGILRNAKDMITDPVGALGRVVGRLLNLVPGKATNFGRAAVGAGRKLLGAGLGKVKNMFGNLVGGGGGAGSPGGSQALFNWIRARIPGAILASGYRRGDWGYHGQNRAADLVFSDGSERTGGGLARRAFNLIKSTFFSRIKELIWDFAGGNAVWNGRNHFFTGSTAGPGTHNDHIHWAMRHGGIMPRLPFGSYDSGGYLPRGLSLAYNGTGAPERVGGAGGTYNFHFHGPVGSRRELDNWVVQTMDRLRKERRL